MFDRRFYTDLSYWYRNRSSISLCHLIFCFWPLLHQTIICCSTSQFDAWKIFRGLSLYGFHADGGGGGVGNIGGIAEKIVFLSMLYLPVGISAIEISAATKPAFAARVGSV